MPRFGFLLLTSLWLLAPPNAIGQSAHRSRFLRWTMSDGRDLGTVIARNGPVLLAGGGAIILPAVATDAPLLEEVQEGYRGQVAAYLNLTNRLGGKEMPIPVVGLFAASLLTRNDRLQDAAYTSMESLFYAGIITGALKAIVGRARPEANRGVATLSPFSGNSSFPSGHATAAFAIVTPWVLYYPHGPTYVLVAVGMSTAVARVALDKHWPTDVVAGSAIGFLTARFLTRRHQATVETLPSLTLSPLFETTGDGLRLNYRF